MVLDGVFDRQLCEMTIVFLALLVACSGDSFHLDCVPANLASICIFLGQIPDHL